MPHDGENGCTDIDFFISLTREPRKTEGETKDMAFETASADSTVHIRYHSDSNISFNDFQSVNNACLPEML
jgi:hypothetical protein